MKCLSTNLGQFARHSIIQLQFENKKILICYLQFNFSDSITDLIQNDVCQLKTDYLSKFVTLKKMIDYCFT